MNQHFLHLLKSNKFFSSAVLGTFFSSLIIFLSLLLLYSHLPTKLPLMYSLPWGPQQLISKQQILILPAIIILISLSNIILSFGLHSEQTFLKKILLLSAAAVSLIVLITALKILTIFI